MEQDDRPLRRPALLLAVASSLAGVALLPLVLFKPGRILSTPEGELIINPVSFRGLGVLLAADVACVVGIHLLRSLRRPRTALLPVNPALLVIAGSGLLVGALGARLLAAPWQPFRDAAITLPPANSIDLAGFVCAALSLLAFAAFRPDYARFAAQTAARPERSQGLRERLHNGFFMGLIAGTIAGAIAAVGGVLLACGALGAPSTWKGTVFLAFGIPVSLFVQVLCVGAGLRGRITRA